MDVELAENGVYESDGPTQEMQNDQSESQESDVEIQIRRRHLSVNVNGNDDEQDSEEVDIEENPLDESELIQDYKIESLQLYDSAYEWLLKSADEYCFISVIGKSRFGKSLSQVLLPLLRPKRDFRRIAYFDECGIDFYWSGEEKVIFLVPKSTNDFSTLIELAKKINSANDEFNSHSIHKESETKNALINLFLLSICHLCLLIQPTTTLDLELDRWFRSIEDSRKTLLPTLAKILGLLGHSDNWRRFGRPCPPRLLLLFEKCALSQEDLRDFADGDFARSKRKRVPQKRLVDSLQNQVYNIFRHSRVLTDSVANNIFTIPMEDNYVIVLQPSENRQMEDSMPIPSYLELLQESIRIQRESEVPSRDGPPSDRHAMIGRWGKRRRAAELWKSKSEKEEDKPAPVDGELWTFLIGHIGPILSGKGHNDQQPVNNRRGKPTPQTGSHFESISCQTLFNTADLLYRFLFLDKLPETEQSQFAIDATNKLNFVKQRLRKTLDPELNFSEARCSKLLPESHSAYLTSLPSHYTTRVHNNQVQQALLVYRQHARGPALDKYEVELRNKCAEDWKNGRQLCEIRSLTDRHCVHKWHRLPGEPGDGPIMTHNSRSRTLATSNCGRMQVQRDDPFNLEEANSKFYKDLEEKLNPKFIHFEFDTFNPDLDLGSLTLNTQDSGNSQTQSQSTSQTINKQGDTGTTDDDVMNAEEGEVKAVVVSRNRFLKGMETTDSPKGLLPLFSSWNLIRTGDFGSYSELKGIEQPGFVHRTNFLLRWDITPELRGFIGYEYETARGSRFFLQTPVKAVQGGSSGPIANASVLLEHENMPLYVPGPSSRSGRTSSQSTGQLMRIWIAIPPGAKDLVTISPLVTPGRNSPTFKTTPDEILLGENSIWILRLPFIYQDEERTYFSPKDIQEFIHYKIHKVVRVKKS